jgi:hypothetical protein
MAPAEYYSAALGGLALAHANDQMDQSIQTELALSRATSEPTVIELTTQRSGDPERRSTVMHADTHKYNRAQSREDREICELLAQAIDRRLPEAENKIWHAHPVWFLDGNPVVGYSKLKAGIRLLFWSGQSFDEEGLKKEGRFKAAEATYITPDEISSADLERWLDKARDIQWDYKNLTRRRGRLQRLK